ncbi:class I SAM-dependent methyltransferase [Pelagibacteraceae bacterium]|nr:class I SAM-dependent methyltransferase [Pelagibacteraceae bacterium]
MINKKYLKNLRCKEINNKNNFIFDLYNERIIDSLDVINIKFKKILILGDQGSEIYKYIHKRFKEAQIKVYDIKTKFSKSDLDIITKSNIDIDFWRPQEKEFDLIISNFYLNICEDLKTILSKIMKSLIPNGFLLATLPSPENFSLLRSAMMKTDMQLYGGTYNRFNRAPELHTIIDLLKKNNFKIPLVDYETIDLTYNQFNKLLNDVRSMNLSYYQKDKKNTFEKKSYFSKLEGNFEKENDYFNLKSNFYIISGWKDHSSQQKPIRPGKAKNKLADFL